MRFLLASACLGIIAFWASEVFFWSIPHPDFALADQAVTCLAYMFCASVALYVVTRAGVQGVKAAFLGGAVLGYLVEGAVVGTMYDAFPFQLVWTPLAWHALISGGVVLGLGRAGGALQRLGLWLGLGVFGAVLASYWPKEHPIPGQEAVLAYLMGFGALVVAAQLALDRIGPLTAPPLWVMALPGGLLGASWAMQGVATLSPLRLLLPVILAVLVWLAFRVGDRQPLRLGPSGGWRHGLFLVTPLVTAMLGRLAWDAFPEGLEIWPLAVVTCLVALIWLGSLLRPGLSAPR
ncbi:hypothetical protein [Stagnihabitans tardus]|uniref:Uncharacterized protein n=1 Tax=Stagnihabitans tardus TaxID=2699202 RepID=A0AAE4Y8B8_9RHOB|nr:hypothetical protein [Stagnihabitans tardus]NBZ87069.1 hypothetical protein [Stagnihabitans tardus]